MKVWIPFLAVLALMGCKKDTEPPASPASVETVEVPAVEDGELDPRQDPEARDTERGPDDPAWEPSAGSMTACEAYARCCIAYATSLGSIDGVAEESVKAVHDGCKAIMDIEKMTDAQESCQMALDALKEGVEAMKAMPEYVPPVECY